MNNEILIFPRGNHYIQKYDNWLMFDDDFFQKVLLAFNSNLPKPFIDIDHEQGAAVGEITELYDDEEGLKGKVNWNEKGLELVKNNEYRYTSPSFGEIVDTNGVRYEIYLDSVSLTNIPALLTMKKIQEQLLLSRGLSMKNKRIILSQITDEAIKNVIEELITQGESMEDVVASLEKEKATLQAKIDELQKEIDTKSQEVETMKSEQLNKEADDFITKQIEVKKLNVKHSGYWKKQFLLNKKEVIDYFESINDEQNDITYKLSNKYKLSQDDITVMKSLKLDLNNEKDIELYLKSNKEGV